MKEAMQRYVTDRTCCNTPKMDLKYALHKPTDIQSEMTVNKISNYGRTYEQK